MYFEKHLKTFVFFLLCIFAQNTFSMKVSVRGIILANNVKSVFLNELQSASEETLKQACALLGAQIKVKKANPETQAIIKLARMIDTPIGTTWSDIKVKKGSSSNANEIGLDNIKWQAVGDIISTFVLEGNNNPENIETELRRAVQHLVKHDIDRSHVISDINDRKPDASFFFLVFASSNNSLSKDSFLDALLQLVLNNFERADFSVEQSANLRCCFQIKHDFSKLFPAPTTIFNIPLYALGNFLFVPICSNTVAQSIALRFSIQKCRQVKRLYFMTLFPLGNGRNYLSDTKLQALTILNGSSDTNEVERSIASAGFFEIPYQARVLNFGPTAHIDIETQIPHLSIKNPTEGEIDIPPQSEFSVFSFHCLLL